MTRYNLDGHKLQEEPNGGGVGVLVENLYSLCKNKFISHFKNVISVLSVYVVWLPVLHFQNDPPWQG
jgi:hypothetical protein